MKSELEKAQAAIEKAAEKMAVARARHREEFRIALCALYNEYGLCVEASGAQESKIEINDIHSEYPLSEIPL